MSCVLRLGTVALVVATLAACTRNEPPAPVLRANAPSAMGTSAPAPAGARMAAAEPPQEIVVGPNESLYLVARRNNVPVRTLIEANDLKPPYGLRNGQRLVLPRSRTHQVQPGDTLAAIARRYGLGTNELVRANGLAPPYAVHAGQLLTLPGMIEPVAVAATPAPAAAPRTASPGIERAPARGAVESAALPPLSVPGPAMPAPPAAVVSLPGAEPPAVSAPASQPSAVPAQPVSLPAPEPADEEPATRPGRGFLWPVRGSVISDFGSKPGGLQNDGINIAAARGTPIRAAETGTVVYAGNELRGFGNLLLVRHKDGWITAYAHAEELTVKRGDDVRRGQTIGRVGATGGVTSPQLHFEIRRGSRPLNPRDFLGPLTASAAPLGQPAYQ